MAFKGPFQPNDSLSAMNKNQHLTVKPPLQLNYDQLAAEIKFFRH